MNNKEIDSKPEFKHIICECCQYPIAIPAQASVAVCFACPQCGNRSCV